MTVRAKRPNAAPEPAAPPGLPVAILSIEGTNCDGELAEALRSVGAAPEIVHLKQLEGRGVEPDRRRSLAGYAALFLPGGWSGGDYVRAGAIFAARLRAALGPELEAFVRSGRPIGGICNGFQVLLELGLLPGRADGRLGAAEAALLSNASGHFECRPTYVAWNAGNFAPLAGTPPGSRFRFSVAHAEGQLNLGETPEVRVKALEQAGQILFRYVAPDGGPPIYPWNPNGSVGDIAGLTNPTGTVFGMMPHPERAYRRVQGPDWTRDGGPEGWSDGHRFLAAVMETAARASAPPGD